MRRILLYSLLFAVLPVFAQQTDWSKVTRVSEQSVIGQVGEQYLTSPSWVSATSAVRYDVQEQGKTIPYIMWAKTGKKEPLIRQLDAFIRQYQALSGDKSITDSNLGIYALDINEQSPNIFYFSNRGKYYKYDRLKDSLSVAPRKTEDKPQSRVEVSSKSTTEDRRYTMLGKGYNLYVRDNQTGKVKQLTTDGREYATYCSQSKVDSLSEKTPLGAWYGHKYLVMVKDDSEVGDLYIIHSLGKKRPQLKAKKMPLPQEAGVRHSRLYWYDADADKWQQLPIDAYQDQKVELGKVRDNRDLYFTRQSRTVDSLQLCYLNVQTGEVRPIITEVSKPHLNIDLFNYYLINNGKEILWWSDRSGRGNYYRYDNQGKLLGRVTQGEMLVVGRIEHIDSLGKKIVFVGYGAERGVDPNYAYYYVVGLDGKGQRCLTPSNGQHELTLSANKRYAVDKCSRMDMPPVYSLVDITNPHKPNIIKAVDERPLLAGGWVKPKLIEVLAADNTTKLYGLMYLPSDLDPSKKYPIISNVYPGPQSDQIPRAFTIDDNGNQSLAELGFIVINIQPRGSSPLRDKAFYTYGYGNLRDYPLADDKHTIEELAKQYSFIDLDRVGIYGHSGGAFQTVTAMLTYPDFYKVGVAASGNYDNNIYIQWWGETYHGAKRVPTTMELAGKLKGKLLLMTGDEDDNVPHASTLRLVDAFIKKNKRIDFFILPGMDHSVYGPYYDNLIRYYFRDNLLNPTKRDIDIVNHN